ncbi:MAG: hypothetical protein E7426_07450 [Ruminococcaceae bacterium]|jgi:hypothetical protein|nr:hypothetical protein [Oscillospiraceae bacterium]
MDEKRLRRTKAIMYLVCAVAAVVVALVKGGSTRGILLAVLAAYCVVMAFVHYRAANREDPPEK